jgi:hypothetical protein
MTEMSSQDLDQIVANVNVAEAATRAAIKEIWDTRTRLKRAEATLALVLGSLTEFHEQPADYVVYRLSQELRRLAEIPETAAALAGCAGEDVDSGMLKAIASHLCGSRSGDTWASTGVPDAVMH